MAGLEAGAAVVAAIQQSTKVQIVEVDGDQYLSRQTYLPPEERSVKVLKAHTLSAIGTYALSEWGNAQSQSIMAHIVSPIQVDLVGQLQGRHNTRHTYLSADCSDLNQGSGTFKLNTFMDPEIFIIGLLSQFTDTGDRAEVLQLVGGLRGNEVTEASDDGFSQSVTVRKGVSSIKAAEVPSVVSLSPYRTFRAIEQPPSDLLLRFRKGSHGPQVALFVADGSGWMRTAMLRIYEELTESFEKLGLTIPIIF